jgi:hypothetical protein
VSVEGAGSVGGGGVVGGVVGGGVVGGAGTVGVCGLSPAAVGCELSPPPPQAPRTDRAATPIVICKPFLAFMENMLTPLVKPWMGNAECMPMSRF